MADLFEEPWWSRLRPASFRGIEFLALSAETDVGRRVVVHELPLSEDDPPSEDVGRKTRTYRIVAVCDGEDYLDKRDALETACETAGAADLIHPTKGRLRVICTSCTTSESSDSLRLATLNLEFVAASSALLPIQATDPLTAITATATDTQSTMAEQFAAAYDALSHGVDVAAAAASDVLSETERIRSAVLRPASLAAETVSAIVGGLEDLAAAAGTLIATPSDLADAWVAVLEQIDDVDLLATLAEAAGWEGATATASTARDQAIADNTTAQTRLITRVILCQGAIAATVHEYATWDDAIAARDLWSGYLSSEAQIDADAYGALMVLMAQLMDSLTQSAELLPRLTTLTVLAPTPDLVLAADLYQDTDRASEISERNAVVCPSMCLGTLEVLDG